MLHRHAAMFLGRKSLALSSKLCQTAADAEARVTWFDDIVDVTELCGLIRIGERLRHP